MSTIVPSPREIAKRERQLIEREAEHAHRLCEHVGLPKDPDCGLCRAGVDPLTLGHFYDLLAVEAERASITRANRERVALTAALYADIEQFEAFDAA